ncbi:MAG: hypothetical protein IPP76_04780 [Moraxellaceae bacterium]|nr:hypothetical protein [Moraxellaceae bacterium]
MVISQASFDDLPALGTSFTDYDVLDPTSLAAGDFAPYSEDVWMALK